MIAWITEHQATIWLILGGLFIVLEAGAIPGIGFLFAGLSAITLGGLMAYGVLDHTPLLHQLGYFLLLSMAWTALLWKPLKKLRTGKKQEQFHDMIGETVQVLTAATKKKSGTVRWSGTTMTARIDSAGKKESFAKGDEAVITKADGTTLFIK